MPRTRVIADALGVVTICLVAVVLLLGIFCILYSLHFHSRIHRQSFSQLSYFSGPWIIRIVFIIVATWWGFGEILRLNLLRHHGRLLNSLDVKWQKNVCKGYILSNLGFAEPCFFLTLTFLLRASLQKSGTLGREWNGKTILCVLLFCLPMFVSQIMVILIGSVFKISDKLPSYFYISASNKTAYDDDDIITFCTYPLLSTILLGLFAAILSSYFFWIGRRILRLVINKVLQRRVYTLIFSVPGSLLLRVLLLGVSVRLKPGGDAFEAVTFLAFFFLVCCIGVGICILVYLPVADSLAIGNIQNDIEARRRFIDEHNESVLLISNQIPLGTVSSPVRTSETSTKCGSISFRALEKDEGSQSFVELSVFSPGRNTTPPGSPGFVGWPMLPRAPIHSP